MTVPVHSLRGLRHSTLSLILLVAFAGIAGCANDHSSGGMSSPPDWVVVPSGGQHAKSAMRDYIAIGGSIPCTECHGADLSGGTSRVSCFGNPAGCHHGPVSGWIATSPVAQNHGISAKQSPGSFGFVSCQICHGSSFSGGTSGVSCYTCHGVSAPHAAKPWRGLSGSPYTHTDTAEAENAPVCYRCHAYSGTANPNNPHVPPTPAPAGTTPGCFNGTMCHNEGGHPAGWAATAPAGQPHGDAAKKDNTVWGQGFPNCQTCHGSSFSGGTSGVSCSTCHGVSAPHAPKPWRGLSGSPYTHTDTAEAGNAPVCYQCHAYTGTANPTNPHAPPMPAPAGTTPGCFNGTMCHNDGGHPVPFNTTTHYSVTNATFTANCGTCHGVTGTSPVSGAPLCTTCHTAGSPLTALSCTSCHANPPTGVTTAYPNVAGAHATHIALNATGAPVTCNTCHNGLGSATLGHYNRANAIPGKNALRVSPGEAAFVSTYNAETGGTASFSSTALTCSVVSCHGGQTTPNWRTGTIDVPNACLDCHISGTTQYNSYFSGEHDKHIREFGLSARTCKRCHDVAKVNVSGHFQNLATPAFEQTARGTILSDVRYIGNSCNPRAGELTGCHSSKKW